MKEFFEYAMAGFLIVGTFMIISALATPIAGGIVAFAVASVVLKK